MHSRPEAAVRGSVGRMGMDDRIQIRAVLVKDPVHVALAAVIPSWVLSCRAFTTAESSDLEGRYQSPPCL